MNNPIIICSLILIYIVSIAGIAPWFVNYDTGSDTQKMSDRNCTPLLSDWNDTPSSWNCPYSSKFRTELKFFD
jgi:hypothetical protein